MTMRRTSLAALLSTAALLAPAAPARASQNLFVVRGDGPGSATIVVPRRLALDPDTLRSTGCRSYAGLSFHGIAGTTRPVTVLRVAAVDAVGDRAVHPYPALVFGAPGTSSLVLKPGTYRVDLHADRACAVSMVSTGLHAPWVTTVTRGKAETFAAASLAAAGPVVAGTAQWQIPADATATIVVTIGLRQDASNGVAPSASPDAYACAGSAPHLCAPADDGSVVVSASTGSSYQSYLVASRYVPAGDPADPTWASARIAGPYAAAAAAMLVTR